MDDGANALLAKAGRVLRTLQHRRWLVIAVAWVIALVCLPAIFLVPERYEASARIFVDTQTVLKPMLKELAYQPDIDQQVRMLARTLISRPNIQRLLDRPEVGLAFGNPKDREQVVNRLMDQIKVVVADRGNLYSVTYKDINVKRARQVVEGTVALFVTSGTDVKKRDSVDAGHFIEEQIKTIEAKLVNSENRLKDFKIRNFGMTGVSTQDHFQRMATLSDEVTKLRSDLRAAEQSRDAYRRELAAEDPRLPAESLPNAAAAPVSEIDNRVLSQRQQLDDLLRRFTENHPDVVNARRLLARLEQEKRQEAEALAKLGGRSRGTAATSPVYQKIRIALADSEAQVASLRSQLAAQVAQLDLARSKAGRVPVIEAELAQLNRDYEVVRKNYDLLVARRESASLGVKLDESSQLADFRVIEPARASPSPVFPSRLHLALIVAILSAAAGVGVAMLVEVVFPTLRDSKLLEQISGRPVLGTVTVSKTPEWQLSARRDRLRFLATLSLLIAFQVIWLGWLAFRSLAR